MEHLANTPEHTALYTPAGRTLALYIGEVGGVCLIIAAVGALIHTYAWIGVSHLRSPLLNSNADPVSRKWLIPIKWDFSAI